MAAFLRGAGDQRRPAGGAANLNAIAAELNAVIAELSAAQTGITAAQQSASLAQTSAQEAFDFASIGFANDIGPTGLPAIGDLLAFAATGVSDQALGGTVTSVALTMPAEFSVAGSPVTLGGTLAVTKATESANTIWAGPTTGSAAQPAFRALVVADIPSLSYLPLAGGTLTGPLGLPYSRQVPLTGFSITIGNGVNRLILDPAGTLATGTVTMPTAPIDGHAITISSSQIITALTVSPSGGQTLDGALTTIGANGFASWTYVLATTTWYRTG